MYHDYDILVWLIIAVFSAKIVFGNAKIKHKIISIIIITISTFFGNEFIAISVAILARVIVYFLSPLKDHDY